MHDLCISIVNLAARLKERIELTPEEFSSTLKQREEFLNIIKGNSSLFDVSKAYAREVERLAPGTFYLSTLDKNLRRAYGYKQSR